MPSASDKLREILSKDLNRLLETESFAQQECFKFLLDSSGHDAAGKADSRRVRINRKLLERAFPDLIQPVVLDRPRLIAIIRVIALIFLLRSLMNIGTVHLTKDLNFDRLFILETVGAVVEMSVSIGLVLVLGSVWALVVGRLVSSFLVCLCSYIVHPYRPKLSFDFGLIKNLFGYGKHVFSGTVLNFLVLEGDDIFVGKFFGASLLGLYRYAYKISNIAATEIGNLLGEVAFPAYSKLQDNMPKLLAGFRRTVQLMTLLAYPVSGGLMVLAGEFTSVFLGPKWMGMVPAMQIMCVLGAAKCLHIGVVFMSIGRPDMQVKFTLLRLVVMIVTIYPLAKFYGLTGVAFSVTFSAMVPLPWQLWSMKKIIKFPIRRYLSLLSLPFFATLIMMAVLMAIKQFLPVGFLSLVAQVALGASIYIGSVFALSRLYDNYNPLDIMMQFKKVLLDGKKA
jgi:O-antigen/teichoic acid export membrane protein